jgi:hypothetical protein
MERYRPGLKDEKYHRMGCMVRTEPTAVDFRHCPGDTGGQKTGLSTDRNDYILVELRA